MTMHPNRLVRDASTLALAVAFGAQHPRGFVDDESGTRTICPRCRHLDHNGPSMEIVNSELLHCWHCRLRTNRARLERLILETPELLDALASELVVAS